MDKAPSKYAPGLVEIPADMTEERGADKGHLGSPRIFQSSSQFESLGRTAFAEVAIDAD
jgi:hypothetical protein